MSDNSEHCGSHLDDLPWGQSWCVLPAGHPMPHAESIVRWFDSADDADRKAAMKAHPSAVIRKADHGFYDVACAACGFGLMESSYERAELVALDHDEHRGQPRSVTPADAEVQS